MTSFDKMKLSADISRMQASAPMNHFIFKFIELPTPPVAVFDDWDQSDQGKRWLYLQQLWVVRKPSQQKFPNTHEKLTS